MTLFFEDFTPGSFGCFGPCHVSREDIIAFASEFDAQPMHLDEEAANRSLLKGLAGSGWHLCAIASRMSYDGFLHRTAVLGSPGVNEVKWLSPLRPGDDLMLDVDIESSRPSSSRSDCGVVDVVETIRNAAGQTLLSLRMPLTVQRRDRPGVSS
ncbi:MAG: enoyl-CoA hydratase [Rhizobiales bacterium]|nr:enoyl-CoA hydratase [Hyphomicrobiales bacterium]